MVCLLPVLLRTTATSFCHCTSVLLSSSLSVRVRVRVRGPVIAAAAATAAADAGIRWGSVRVRVPVRYRCLLYYSFRSGFLPRSCSSFNLLLTVLLEVILFQPPLFIVFDLHHKTNNRDRPTRSFYCIDPSLYRVVPDLFHSLYVSFLFLFLFVSFFVLLLL